MAILEVNSTTPARAETANEAIEQILGMARQHLGMDLAFLGRFAGDKEVFEAVDTAASFDIHEGDSIPLEGSYCVRVFDKRLPNIVHDSATTEEVKDLRVTVELGIGSYIGVPIEMSDGSVYGALCCISHTANPDLADYDVRFVKLLAGLIAKALDRRVSDDQDLLTRENRIRQVLTNRQFAPAFQPIVNLREFTISGVEALSRFSGRPPRTPDLWFAEAWRAGLGPELELAAATEALAHLSELDERAYMSVNFSAETLLRKDFDDLVQSISSDRILVEVTEHDVVEDYDALRQVRDKLRDLGVGFAIDDAGAGFASLKHIIRLVPDVIKLDVFLCRDIDRDPVKRALASSLVSFAIEIGARLVAEGIETEDELATLLDLGIIYGQGYLLGRPGDLARLTHPVGPGEARHFGEQRVVYAGDTGELDSTIGLGAGGRLRAVFDLSPEAIILVEADATVRGWNATAERIFGWSAEEAIGRSVIELIVPVENRRAVERWLELDHSSAPLGAPIRAPGLHKDGSRVEVDLLGTSGWRTGRRASFVIFARDAASPAPVVL